MNSPLRLITGLVATAMFVAACGGDDSTGAPPGPERGTVDWSARTIDLEVPARWTVEFCAGAGPVLCISRDGTAVGAVELLDFHRATLDGFDGDLAAFARDVYDAIATDRRQGCGAGYRFDVDDVETVTIGERRGVRYSFTGHVADGRPAERGVGFSVLVDDVLFTIGANAYEAEGCVGTEGGEFDVATLRAFEPVLGEIASASVFPRDGGAGTVSGYLRSIDRSGRVRVDPARILSGLEAVEAAREMGVIGPDEELETDFFVYDPDDITYELQVSDRTHVELLDCTTGCELVEVPVEDLLSGAVRPYGGAGAIFSISLADGEIVSVVEQYLP